MAKKRNVYHSWSIFHFFGGFFGGRGGRALPTFTAKEKQAASRIIFTSLLGGHLRFALNKLSFKIRSGWSYKDDFTVISICLAAGAGDAPADHWAERLREVQLVPNPQRLMASLPGNPAQTPDLIHVLHSTKVICTVNHELRSYLGTNCPG